MPTAPAIAEHLFVLVFAVVYPVLGYFSFRRLTKRFTDADRVPRLRLYAGTVAGHWLLCGAGLWLWLDADRTLAELGFRMEPGANVVIGALLVGAGIALLLSQLRTAASADRETLESITRSFGLLHLLLPHSRRELHAFYVVGGTAGFVEEVLWRGYLLAYLGYFLPGAAAAVLVIAGFGIAHAYQGRAAIPKVTAVGAVFTGLYLLADSLWPPILLHAAVDILQGRMAYTVIRRSEKMIGTREAGAGRDATIGP